MKAYRSISKLLGAVAQDVAASATRQVVSEPFAVTAQGALHFRYSVLVGKCVTAGAIEARLDDSAGYGTWTGGLKAGVNITGSTDTVCTTNVAVSTTNFHSVGHPFSDGQAVALNAGTLPDGLLSNCVYYVKTDGADDFALSRSTNLLPLAAFSADGVNVLVTPLREFSETYLCEVAADQAYTPLRPMARVTITTGLGETAQIMDVLVQQEN